MNQRITHPLATFCFLVGTLTGCVGTSRYAPLNHATFAAERIHMTSLALQSWDAKITRLNAVRARLWQAAYEKGQCKNILPERGTLLESDQDIPRGLRAEVLESGLRRPGFYVVAIAPGSPAYDAGLQVGDRIVGTDSKHIPVQDELPRDWLTKGILAVDVIGSDGPRTLEVGSVLSCGLEVVMDESFELDAFYDGSRIHISQGMVQALPDDATLAFVVAHEFGHSISTHSLLLSLVDVGAKRDNEREADMLGIQLVAAAGYDTTRVLGIWDYLAKIKPNGINSPGWFSDHPMWAERKLRMQIAIDNLKP